MNFYQSFIEAVESLVANKMRSGLTILGIVIGVGAVIAMLGIGQGAEESVAGSIESIGTDLLFVYKNNEVSNATPLTLADADAIKYPSAAPSVLDVSAQIQSSGEVTYSSESFETTIYGVTPSYEQVRNSPLSEGRFIDDRELQGYASVAVLGSNVAEELFGRTGGLMGEMIRVNGQPFQVIGVLEEKGGGSGFGVSEDDLVMVPLTTAQVRLTHRGTRDEVDVIYVQAVDGDSVLDAQDEVSQILRTRHRTNVGEDDFTINAQQELLDTFSSVIGIITMLLGGIAGISLLVGGIGIMNIMLVSVTERTREIGLRKALGARKADILAQFLTESAVLSLVGGMIGILLGWGLAAVIAQIAASSGTEMPAVITLDSVLLATLFSAAVGIFFGFYPANRAAGLQPVEALRYE